MITNADVTLWHNVGYDPETRMDAPPLWQYFPRVSLQQDMKTTVDNGLKSADVLKIRIPGEMEIRIKNGDRLMIGYHPEAEAPDTAFTVVGFADNRKGSKDVWHWKVVCG